MHMSAHLSNHLDISSTGSIIRGNGINDTDDITLHHPNVVGMAVALCHVQKVFDEIHDVGASVHVILVNSGQH